ncbi:MAG: site-specific DNA-methyltransferase [Patescibacteria group bacterium]
MNKYKNLSKEELLRIINKQERELVSKKYGLFWDSEREPEQVVLDCANNLPVLKRVKGKEIKTDDSEDNILIEGDNYHALTVLNYTHKGKIDVIYIDPPYNTGNKSWKYNNNYIEKDDGYYHSKWLNMMEKRLNVAKKLLKNTGVLICTIDENEHATLGLLLQKVFAGYEVVCVSIIHNPGGIQGKNFSYTHEYAYFIIPSGEKRITQRKLEKDKIYISNLRNWGGESLRSDAKNCFYPIIIKNKKIIGFGPVAKDDCHPKKPNEKKNNGEIYVWPIDSKMVERKWRYARQTVENILEKLIIKENGGEKQIMIAKEFGTYKTVWVDKKYNADVYGTKLLSQIIDTKFPFPKSLYAVEDCIKAIIHNKDDAIILDFFAGSGTTGHAVLKLNKEDKGKRKFILCTNNEDNNGDGCGKIAENICYPRIEKVIKGYKKNGNGEKVEGLGGNLQYFKTSLVKKTNDKTQVKIDLTQKCVEMLCVKENIFNLEMKKEDFKIFSSNKKDKFLCVYFNFLENSFEDFLAEIQKLKGKKFIYMFSLENEIKKSLFNNIKNKEIKPIPQEILDIYEELVKKNITLKKEIIFLEIGKAKKKIFEEKEKDDGAKNLRIVLEKILQKIAQQNGIGFLRQNGKEEKVSVVNDRLKKEKIISQIIWEENKTYLTIGNDAMHGKYDDFNLVQIENFYQHTQNLINKFNF